MRLRTHILSTASLVVLGCMASPAWAQDQAGATAAADTPADEETIVVTGIRASLQSAQGIKRRAPQIVDTIVAEDIGKLPDIAVSETVARIPGIQVIRRAGEADTVLVRGLPDFATTYNGREIFTAETRVVALQDFPAANIAALEVFKTSTADLVEPGLAGLVNVRSRRPFDFDGFEVAGSAWALYTKQANKVTPNGNLLITDRWEAGDSEFGALLNFSYTDLTYTDSEISNTDFIAGGPNGTRFPDIQRLFYKSGNRKRPSVNGAVQWRPSPGLELYAEGLWQGFRNEVSDRLLSAPLWGGSQYTNLVLRPSTDLLQSGVVTNPFRADGFQGGTYNKTDTYQFAFGGSYDAGSLRLKFDAARTTSTFTGETASVDYRLANRQTVVFNNGLPQGQGGGPQFSFQNFDAANPANYLFQGYYEEAQQSKGQDWQFRFDAEYDTGIDILPKLQAGVRYNTREAHREFGNRFAQFDNRAIPISSVPLTYQLFNGGFRGTDVQPGLRTFLTPTYDSIRSNRTQMRNFIVGLGAPGFGFGTFNAADPAADPLQTYNASEKALAGYVQASFAFGNAIDGVFGLRAVRTTNQVAGNSSVRQPDPDGAGPLPAPPNVITPVSVGQTYTDWLPNASLRWHITPELQLRLSASQTRTRPTFGQLNPSATINPPITACAPGQTDPFACARTGNGGNPFLKPFTSNNFDASLEYYFSRVGFVSAAVFRRDLFGFIQNSQVRYIDPQLGPLILSGPINTGKGRIDGFELQLSTTLDFEGLPSFVRNFGFQANLTYLDAKTGFPNGAGAFTLVPILGVAKWTYNLAGFYEKDGLSVRVSFNKRGSSTETIQNRGNDLYYEVAHPAGRLDLSSSYAFSDKFSVFFDWTNILGKPFRQDLFSARDGAARSEYTRFFRFEEEVFSLGARFRL